MDLWSQAGTSASTQPSELPADHIEPPPVMPSTSRSSQPNIEHTLPIPEVPQIPTPLPATPRRRRRRFIETVPSPAHRRTRTQTQSELARQAFVNSDIEWRVFQQRCEEERLRLRERELNQQDRWLEIMAQLIQLGNRMVDAYQNN